MTIRIILALCAALALTACSDTGAPSAPTTTTTVTPPVTTTVPATTTTTTTITTTTTVSQPRPPAAPANTPEVNVPAPAYYANCDAARRAGAAPIRRGEPGYRRDLDRDGDGIACDK